MSKNIVVVGGSKGIGLATILRLSNQGHTIYAYSRTEGELPVHLIEQHITVDITAEDFPADTLPDVVHGLVYCPGSIDLKPFRSIKIEQFATAMDVNLYGAIKSIKACLRPMKKSDITASIVLFSTVAVQQGMPFHASVAAAKGAIEGLGRSLAAELAPKIRVNIIAPSLTDTPLASKLLSNEDRREASNQRHPLKRYGKADDIAAGVQYLLSDDSSWMSGQVIGIDGGMSSIRT